MSIFIKFFLLIMAAVRPLRGYSFLGQNFVVSGDIFLLKAGWVALSLARRHDTILRTRLLTEVRQVE